MQSPTPEEIKQYRTASGLTQTQAAELIYCSLGAFQKWEQGDRAMHPAFFELFKIKIEGKYLPESMHRGLRCAKDEPCDCLSSCGDDGGMQ